MANIKSAKKRVLQSRKRNAINMSRNSAIKTAVKKVVAAIESGKSKTEVQKLFVDVQAKFSRAKSKGTVHPNKASRKIGRLAKRVNAVAVDQKAAK